MTSLARSGPDCPGSLIACSGAELPVGELVRENVGERLASPRIKITDGIEMTQSEEVVTKGHLQAVCRRCGSGRSDHFVSLSRLCAAT